MRYTLDPELSNVLRWRDYQNIVLDILVNEIYYTPESERKDLPYRFITEPTRMILTDQTGRVVCEFAMVHKGIVVLIWVRSWKDFVEMDNAGQDMRRERLSGKAS